MSNMYKCKTPKIQTNLSKFLKNSLDQKLQKGSCALNFAHFQKKSKIVCKFPKCVGRLEMEEEKLNVQYIVKEQYMHTNVVASKAMLRKAEFTLHTTNRTQRTF